MSLLGCVGFCFHSVLDDFGVVFFLMKEYVRRQVLLQNPDTEAAQKPASFLQLRGTSRHPRYFFFFWLSILCLRNISYCPISVRNTARKCVCLLIFAYLCQKSHVNIVEFIRHSKIAAASPPLFLGALWILQILRAISEIGQ